MQSCGEEYKEDGAEAARNPGRNRDTRNLSDISERLDECGVAGVFDATVVEDAEAGNRGRAGPTPVEDVELDVGGIFREDLIGVGGGMDGEVGRRDGAS